MGKTVTKDQGENMSNGAHRSSSSVEVLEQRIYGTEAGLKQLGEDTSRQIRELASNTTNQIQNLAQSTQSQNASLASQIGKLDSSLQERGKIQWPAFGLLLSAITAIGWLAYSPINNAQTRIEVSLLKLAETTPNYRELDASAKRRDDWQSNSVERFKRIEDDLAETKRGIVPRGEHDEKWRSQDRLRDEDKRSADLRFADQQRQLDAIKTDFSSLYSPRDALTSMQRRLEDLERRLIRPSPQS